MENNDLINDESAFIKVDDDKHQIYGVKTKAVPKEPKDIGIDLDKTLFYNIIEAGEASQLDISQLESFLSVSQNRNQLYSMLDSMANDSTVSAILETYAEDATEYNEKGQIVWAESSDASVAKFVSYLLDTINIDKNIYKWTMSLIKYGDLYIRLFRESEVNDPLFGKDEEKEKLNEEVKFIAFKDSDKFVHYVESVVNPAQMFELTRFGKTQGYIKADVSADSVMKDSNPYNNNFINSFNYQFNKRDISVFGATEFVHACLDDNTSRTEEEVSIFMDDDSDVKYTYNVRRGQSILYNAFKAWRELMLLKNSVLLNRITKSSIVRVIGVEVGDMPKEDVGPHLNGVKSLIEQKTALNVGSSVNEYTNPGPVENCIYVPTRNGIGAITAQQIGGDVDVKSLADLDSFNDTFFGAMRVPKQYFGVTDDSAGFNGGTSLSIISSRYAKAVKRIQNTLIQAITDLVNIMLIDKGLDSYINKFQIHMMPPTTQEEIDRRDAEVNKITIVGDIMNQLSDIDTPSTKLKIVKSLLSNVVTDGEVIELIQEEIEKMESNEEENMEEESSEDEFVADDNTPVDFDNQEESSFEPPIDRESPSEESPNEEQGGEGEVIEEPEENTLPTPSELNMDMTDNSQF